MARRLKSGWGSDRYGWFGTSGDTESEGHGVCVGEVVMYGRAQRRGGERPRKVEWEAAAN